MLPHNWASTLLAFLPAGLAILPWRAWHWSRIRQPRHQFAVTGIAWGLVVDPFSSALYGFYYLSCLTAPVGMIGLALALIHGPPGFKICTLLGLRDPRTVVEGVQHLQIAIFNGVVWSAVYGILGAGVDHWRARHKSRNDDQRGEAGAG